MLLSVDTSYKIGGLALFNQKNLVLDEMWEEDVSHSEILTLKFAEMLTQAQIEPQSIKTVLCASGPGSFTGLRVGMNFSKTLAYSNKISLTLTSSFRSIFDLEIVKKHPEQKHIVLMNAYKNQVFRADYQWLNQTLIEQISSETQNPKTMVCPNESYSVWGDGFEIYKELIREDTKKMAQVRSITSPSSKSFLNPAVRQAELYFNYDYCLKFPNIDPLVAEPLYFKKSEAEENLSRGFLKKHTQRIL